MEVQDIINAIRDGDFVVIILSMIIFTPKIYDFISKRKQEKIEDLEKLRQNLIINDTHKICESRFSGLNIYIQEEFFKILIGKKITINEIEFTKELISGVSDFLIDYASAKKYTKIEDEKILYKKTLLSSYPIFRIWFYFSIYVFCMLFSMLLLMMILKDFDFGSLIVSIYMGLIAILALIYSKDAQIAAYLVKLYGNGIKDNLIYAKEI